MYDLTVDEVHTFAVGDGQWVVHNTDLCDVFGEITLASNIVPSIVRNEHLNALQDGFTPKRPGANYKTHCSCLGACKRSNTVCIFQSKHILVNLLSRARL